MCKICLEYGHSQEIVKWDSHAKFVGENGHPTETFKKQNSFKTKSWRNRTCILCSAKWYIAKDYGIKTAGIIGEQELLVDLDLETLEEDDLEVREASEEDS